MTARGRLDARSADLDRVGSTELRFLPQVDVRVDPTTATNLGFPTEPNTVASGPDRDVLWLGPDEWLVVGDAGTAEGPIAELERSLAGMHRSVVDVSANRTVIELSGPSRHELLASACPIDLHPRSWVEGRCAQTVFGAAQVLVHERDGATRLFVRPSFADYVLDLLLAASAS
ncbi:MAG: sarcosine oxidase subunit gamma family protein [Actinomycetota bacterium]